MAQPMVSVLMPAYNCERYVGDAIRGVLEQTYTDFELIVINDGSTDGTAAVIRAFRDDRIVFLENEKNIGLVRTLNRGLDVARGKYILRTDADDIALPGMAASLTGFMESHPDYVICGGNMQVIGEKRVFTYISDNDHLKVFTLNLCPFSHSTVIIRRAVLEEKGLRYNEFYKDGEDHALWSELLPYGKFHNLEEVTLLYRESTTQITASKSYSAGYSALRRKVFALQGTRYFGLSAEEAEDYARLITQAEPSGTAELARMGETMLKALRANADNRYFDPALLRQSLFVKWHWICLRSYSLGRKVFPVYFRYIAASGNMLRLKSLGTHLIKMIKP
jgi:glycosyltransferase involved in cell wall biosynthesis